MSNYEKMLKVLFRLMPLGGWSLTGDKVTLHNEAIDYGYTEPTAQQIADTMAIIDAEYLATQYQRDRLAEYPPIGEQLDMQYKDALNGTTTWIDTINAIKAKYPK